METVGPPDDKTAGDWPSVKEKTSGAEEDSVENRAPWKLERTLL